jgi:hypothetical protein
MAVAVGSGRGVLETIGFEEVTSCFRGFLVRVL